jgi:hypothetical protein
VPAVDLHYHFKWTVGMISSANTSLHRNHRSAIQRNCTLDPVYWKGLVWLVMEFHSLQMLLHISAILGDL